MLEALEIVAVSIGYFVILVVAFALAGILYYFATEVLHNIREIRRIKKLNDELPAKTSAD